MISASSPLPELTSVVDRRDVLVEWSRGRRVVHLGCVDQHLLEERFDAGLLLHSHIAAAARSVVGVDLDASGLERLRQLVPGEYRRGDVQQLSEIDLPLDTELVLAPELIEHLPSPGHFLHGLREFLAASGAEAVITTPNAYDLVNNLRFALKRREYVHPDHVVLFSPTTLDRMFSGAGLEVVGRHVHRWADRDSLAKKLRGYGVAAMMRLNPWLASGLVWRVRPAP
jgi:hypothetical protein